MGYIAITADLNTFAKVLSEAFPPDQNAHVTEYRVRKRNAAFRSAMDGLMAEIKSGAFK